MSAATLQELREAFVTTLQAAVPDLHCYAYTPDSPQLPAAYLQPTGCEYLSMGRGWDEWSFDLTVIVQSSDWLGWQRELDAYIGPGAKSIRAGIFSTPGLGLTSVNCVVASVRDIGPESNAEGNRLFRATLEVLIKSSGV